VIEQAGADDDVEDAVPVTAEVTNIVLLKTGALEAEVATGELALRDACGAPLDAQVSAPCRANSMAY
jgi:hypothetical protein